MYNFDLKVYVFRRPHMRCESLEYELHMGKNVLHEIFDDETVNETRTRVVLPFPERWLNIVEEQSLFLRLQKYCPNLKTVEVKTQSPHIISTTPRECCFIVRGEEELAGAAMPQGALEGRQWFPNTMKFVNANNLTVLG